MSLAADPLNPPNVGATGRALVGNIPAGYAALALGWSKTTFGGFFPLPLPLGGYGLPGCNLLVSAESAFEPVLVNGATGTYSLSLPVIYELVGAKLYLQAHAPAPGFNPAGMALSNALEWTLGI